MKVLVCGGRDYINVDYVNYVLDKTHLTDKIADSYIKLEELVRDYVANAAANDKWKWKFKDAIKELECF